MVIYFSLLPYYKRIFPKTLAQNPPTHFVPMSCGIIRFRNVALTLLYTTKIASTIFFRHLHIVNKCSQRCENDQRISRKTVFIRNLPKQKESQQRCKNNL